MLLTLLWVVVILAHVVLIWRISSKEAMSDEDSSMLFMTGTLPGKGSLESITRETWLISLDDQVDRRTEALYHIKQSGITSVQTFIAQRSPKGGIHGCMDSHQKIIRSAYDRGVSTITIFEDDARIGAPVPPTLAAEVQSLLAADEARVVFLGHLMDPMMPVEVRTPNIVRVRGRVWMAHAYCLNRAAMKIIMGWKNSGDTHYDMLIANDPGLARFAVTPMIFHQCNCGTSVTTLIGVLQKWFSWPRAMRMCSNSASTPWLLWLAAGISVVSYAALAKHALWK